jgi:hypothetical protein
MAGFAKRQLCQPSSSSFEEKIPVKGRRHRFLMLRETLISPQEDTIAAAGGRSISVEVDPAVIDKKYFRRAITKNPAAGLHRAGPAPWRLYIRARLGIESTLARTYGEFTTPQYSAPAGILAPRPSIRPASRTKPHSLTLAAPGGFADWPAGARLAHAC